MDDSSSANLVLISGLLALQAIITMAYAALQNARQSDLGERADEGNPSAKTALALLDTKSQLYFTYSLSQTLLTVGIILVATLQFLLPTFITDPAPYNPAIGVLIVLGFGLVVVILGNVLPEAIGSAYAMPLLGVLARPLRWIVVALSPLTALLLISSRLLARVFGSDKLVNTITEEEIMTLVNAGHTGGTIEDEAKEMIFSVLQLDETLAREVMIPRMDMVAVDIATAISEALDVLIRTGYSRVPVYEENIDNIVGLLYAKDILNLLNNGGLDKHNVRELLRTAHFVPESLPADKLLRDLQKRNIHMGIIVDEYGGTSGLVTIENIIEEIVGDIRDEYDYDEEAEYIRNSNDEYIVDAGMDLDDLNELLDVELDTSESDTLGGYIYQQIGRVPIVGETLDTDDVEIRVRSLEGRRIRKVLVTLKPRPDDTPDDENDNDDNIQPPQALADAS